MPISDGVGGKNASLGELIRELGSAGVRVPGGFATTTSAYREVSRNRWFGRAHCRRVGVARCQRPPRAEYNRGVDSTVDYWDCIGNGI